jgi:hypothetical protein
MHGTMNIKFIGFLVPRYRYVAGGYCEVTLSLNIHAVNIRCIEKQLDRIIAAAT